MGRDFSPAMAQIINLARGKNVQLGETARSYLEQIGDSINLTRKVKQIPRSKRNYAEIVSRFWREQKALAAFWR